MDLINKEQFNKISTHPLQTWEWGEFRKSWGNELVRFPFGQITLHRLPLTNYKIGIFEKGIRVNQKMIRDLKDYSKKNNIVFIKLEPNELKNENSIKILQENCIKGRKLFTPQTFEIDLTKSEDELLKSFSSKTRYNIRLAQKHGVIISEDNSDVAFSKYLDLTFKTAKRQGFYAHTPKYHKLMWENLNKAGIAHLLCAKYKNEIITAWILFVWKDTLYYPYGASSDKYKFVMANNLMMWEAIKFGKKQNLKKFDLWGKEEGKGFTKFKEGYNPKVVEFVGSWDLVSNKPIYFLYRLAEGMRWFFLKKVLTIFK